jgi:hypothetical protein
MQRVHIDISRDLEGEPVVHACFDLRQDEVAAAAHAVRAIAAERFRTSSMSADEVLELRELTALADELAPGAELGGPADERLGGPADGPAGVPDAADGPHEPPFGDDSLGRPPADDASGRHRADDPGALRTIVFRPARLSTFREAVARFVETRDESEWIREEDRAPLALLRGMLLPLEQLCAEAVRAALSPESHIR